MKESRSEFIESLLGMLVICIAIVVAIWGADIWERNRKSPARRFLESLAVGQTEKPNLSKMEVEHAFQEVRMQLYVATFNNFAGSEPEKRQDAIDRLYRGLKLAEECEKRIGGE